MAISKFHKQADIKMHIEVNIDLTAVNNFYVLIEDTNSAVKKSFALNPEPPFNSDDITLIYNNIVEVRTHRNETADWDFGAYYYTLFVAYDDADFTDAKRIESNSVIGFRLIRDIEPTTDPVDINTFIPGEGAGSFLELSDTPDDYIGQAGKVAMVNTTEDALIFYEVSGIGDMTKAVYDPTGINADAFDYNNFYNTPTIPAPINDTDDLPEGAVNLYYTETRVNNNANVSANTTHRGQTNNPHNVTASQAGARPDTWVPTWGDVTGKPTEFPPEAHTHPASEITDFDTEVSNNADVAANTAHRAATDNPHSTSFLGLTDTPDDYAGRAGQKVVINDAEDGLDFMADVDLGTIEVNYRFDTGTTAEDPTEGYLRLNSADYSLATELYISETDRQGDQRDGMLQALKQGDVILVRDTNSDTKFFTAVVTTTPVDNGTWWTMGIDVRKVGTSQFNQGERCIFGAVYLGVKNFDGLQDTPADKTGSDGMVVRVDEASNQLIYDANTPVSTDTTFGGFKHTFDSGTGTLNLYTT